MAYALRGAVWPGGAAEVIADGAVVVDGGVVVALGPAAALDLPAEVVTGGWVGPGIVDAHVHLAFGSFDEMRRTGVVAVRDLGAPPESARAWRGAHVAVAGPLLTAPGGYPSRSWGADGFARFVATPEEARAAAREVEADVVKVALEPAGGAPVPPPEVVRAVVEAAHDRGLAVTAHALTEAMVLRALDAGVDELCHTPAEPLSERAVERVAASGVWVTSTIETLGDGAARNAARLVAAGVPFRYGTDLGNAGTFPGVDQRELNRLAAAGLGRLGALRAATEWAAAAPGLAGRVPGRLAVGERAYAVVLDRDPVAFGWSPPRLVVSGAETWTGG